MVTSVQRGIKLGSEARKWSVKSHSWVSHESVTCNFWGCYYRAPVGHEGVICFQQNFRVTIRWVNWTCLNTFLGQTRDWNFGKFWVEPPIRKVINERFQDDNKHLLQDEKWPNYRDMAGRYLMPHNYHLALHFWCRLILDLIYLKIHWRRQMRHVVCKIPMQD